jgi:leucyl/phenylalanyl-tRNA--protein transferase
MITPLTPGHLLYAYSIGLFPMAKSKDDLELVWVDPDDRGVFPLDKFHMSRSLYKKIRQRIFEVTFDQAFEQVIISCSTLDEKRTDTWINRRIIGYFMDFHKQGLAHSVECWHQGQLVGGLYGLEIGAAFFGESMFSRQRDASKVALAWLIAKLKNGGFTLLDAQFQTDHLSSMGAIEISRDDYHKKLEDALRKKGDFQCKLTLDDVVALRSNS